MKAPQDAITKLDKALPGAPSLNGNFDEQLVTTHVSNKISTPALLNRGSTQLIIQFYRAEHKNNHKI
jgi:hypothetical protein